MQVMWIQLLGMVSCGGSISWGSHGFRVYMEITGGQRDED